MTPIETLHRMIQAQDWDAVEEQWLAAVEEPTIDVPGLIAVLELLAASDQQKRAGVLYELLADQLEERGDWEQHLTLQHHYRPIFGSHLSHKQILESLRNLYDNSELFRTLADKVGLNRGQDDIPKTWTKVDKLHDLMALAPGTVVEMKGQGAGRVADVNIPLGAFKVDLGGSRPVSVGFAAAPKVLTPLQPDHILYRKVTALESLERLVKEGPDDLLQATLESYDEPMTANEIRTALGGVVSEKQWTSFWNKVKKNPRLMALPGGRQRYQWAESAGDAVSVLEDRFASAPLTEQLDLLKAHSGRNSDLRDSMVAALAKRADGLVNSDPCAAYRIGAAIERVGEDLEGSPWAPSTLLAEADDAGRFVGQLADRSLREDAYRRLPEVREDWQDTFGDALRREPESRTLEMLRNPLIEAKADEVLDRALGDLLNQPRRSPGGFTWMAELAAEDEALLSRSPLRLFQQILNALSDDAFQAQRKRLLALLDSGGTLPRLVHRFEADQAAKAEEILHRSAGLEDYLKKPLENAIHLRFPELHKAEEVPLYTLQASLTQKRAELKELLEVELPTNRKAIEEARELGDLRENFEYKSARQRHEYLSSLATSLNRDLSRARVISFENLDTQSVRLGTRVTLVRTEGECLSYTILGPWESAPEDGILSNESELARRLLGLEVDDQLEIDGEEYRVELIEGHS